MNKKCSKTLLTLAEVCSNTYGPAKLLPLATGARSVVGTFTVPCSAFSDTSSTIKKPSGL